MGQLILDVDTGVDDALALMLAARHPDWNLRAVTCVAGNTSLEGVVRNTITVLDAVGATSVPVAAGAARPLLGEPHDAGHVHGSDGLADLGWPPSTRAPAAIHAVELLRREILASPEPVTLVPLAPMTNIALLLRTYPEVATNIGRIVFMGGSASAGNASPVAEFNVWHDPEAAQIVISSGLPITMYGLDVFYSAAVEAPDIRLLLEADDAGCRLSGQLLSHLARVNGDDFRLTSPGSAGLGDAGAVCAVIDPEGLTTSRLRVEVSLSTPLTRGQTVVDHRTKASETTLPHGYLSQDSIEVALDVDGPRYASLFLDTIRSHDGN
ncbi:nucleoside hydrolase [Paenarthrobacter sp. NPDC092416]|uniref:nucleoside hydrolase n=1 Tax=Paenarthrobacter sp. NPDC092416 TaxID=3364386 RepID=UPI00380EAB4F